MFNIKFDTKNTRALMNLLTTMDLDDRKLTNHSFKKHNRLCLVWFLWVFMNEEKILTKHPEGKKGVNISREKYQIIKTSILNCLSGKELTYTELSNCVGKTKREIRRFYFLVCWSGQDWSWSKEHYRKSVKKESAAVQVEVGFKIYSNWSFAFFRF